MNREAGSQDQNENSQDQASLESDARSERMDRVAVLFGEITAATREFLAALAQSDRHHDWEDDGFGCCAEWLAWRIGITRGPANEKVRVARALEDLPLISEAMAQAELSFSKVRAITRVVGRPRAGCLSISVRRRPVREPCSRRSGRPSSVSGPVSAEIVAAFWLG